LRGDTHKLIIIIHTITGCVWVNGRNGMCVTGTCLKTHTHTGGSAS